LAPASAPLSAATWVSPARDMLHIAAVDENNNVSTTRITTAEESVV